MNKTSMAFLDDLRQHCGAAWRRLDVIYLPLIRGWLQRQGLAGADADDIAQDVVAVVLRRLQDFERCRDGSFRAWLRTITLNCLRDHRRKNWRRRWSDRGVAVVALVDELADPHSALSRAWDAAHDKHVLEFALSEARKCFTRPTWLAFHGVAIDGRRAAEVAAELGLTENAVCIAKTRVCRRIRELASGSMA